MHNLSLVYEIKFDKRKLSPILGDDAKLYLPKIVLYEQKHVEELGFPFVTLLSDKQEVNHVGAHMLS